MVRIAPCVCTSPGWAAPTIPPPATSQASLSLLFSQLEHLFSQGPHLGKYMGQASISVPEIIRKISIISTSNELSTTVNENNFSVEKKSKTNEHASTQFWSSGIPLNWRFLRCIATSSYLNHLVTKLGCFTRENLSANYIRARLIYYECHEMWRGKRGTQRT